MHETFLMGKELLTVFSHAGTCSMMYPHPAGGTPYTNIPILLLAFAPVRRNPLITETNQISQLMKKSKA